MTQLPSASADVLARALAALANGDDLDESTTHAVFSRMMAGDLPHAVIATLLLGLRDKGETAAEIAGAARALRDAMHTVSYHDPGALVDTCGTGGGTIQTLNISTAAAFVVAGAGIPVAKHGNRSFTSRSGSADVLEALGVRIDVAPAHAAATLRDVGLAFLFAPTYHPAMRHVAPVRRELGVTTVMNLLGPLANPAGATRQVIGVSDPGRGAVMADALRRLGTGHAMVVHGEIGLDEVAPMGRTFVWEVRDGETSEWMLDPADLGCAAISLDGMAGGEPHENAAMIESLLQQPSHAPPALRDAVLLNAAAAIHVGLDGMTLEDAMRRAGESLVEGHAAARLAALRRANRVSTSG